MQFPVTIRLHRSFFMLGSALIVHLAAAVTAFLPPWPSTVAWLLLTALMVSALWSARSAFPRFEALRIHGDGRLECLGVGETEFASADLLPQAVVHPALTVFRCRVGGKAYNVVVAADSASADEHRRLRVWLQWRADFSGTGDAPG